MNPTIKKSKYARFRCHRLLCIHWYHFHIPQMGWIGHFSVRRLHRRIRYSSIDDHNIDEQFHNFLNKTKNHHKMLETANHKNKISAYQFRRIHWHFCKLYNFVALNDAVDHICRKSNGICFVGYLFQWNLQIRIAVNIITIIPFNKVIQTIWKIPNLKFRPLGMWQITQSCSLTKIAIERSFRWSSFTDRHQVKSYY